jgi:carbon monoxide dehydrogenase subunit G
MKVAREVEIAASPEAIYEVVMDPHRLAEWVSIHRHLENAPAGALKKGSKLSQCLELAGRKFKVHWEVVEDNRAKHVVWKGRGPMRSKAKVVYDFAASDGVTQFSYTNEYDLPGGLLGKMAGPAVRRVTTGAVDDSLERLKKLIE